MPLVDSRTTTAAAAVESKAPIESSSATDANVTVAETQEQSSMCNAMDAKDLPNDTQTAQAEMLVSTREPAAPSSAAPAKVSTAEINVQPCTGIALEAKALVDAARAAATAMAVGAKIPTAVKAGPPITSSAAVHTTTRAVSAATRDPASKAPTMHTTAASLKNAGPFAPFAKARSCSGRGSASRAGGRPLADNGRQLHSLSGKEGVTPSSVVQPSAMLPSQAQESNVQVPPTPSASMAS